MNIKHSQDKLILKTMYTENLIIKNFSQLVKIKSYNMRFLCPIKPNQRDFKKSV